jgi:hypothetical protein
MDNLRDTACVTVETWAALPGAHPMRLWAGRILTLGLAGVLLWAGAFLIGPSWTAHVGGGTHGTFTATGHSCSPGCEWYGVFNPTDNPTEPRSGVRMGYGKHGIHAVGDVVPAIDAGAPNVFPADGGYDWLLSLGSLAFGTAVVALWCFRALLRRRHSGALL